MPEKTNNQSKSAELITIFLCGDVMTGRGIDQVLPHPSNPTLHESYVRDAGKYVKLAEEVNGPIPKPVEFSYIWGDALEEFERVEPDLRIINLETAVTRSEDYWKGKEVHYRMNPENIPCVTAAKIDCSSLANNHILDWSHSGLIETLETLRKAKIKSAGAGRNLKEAGAPAIMEVKGKGRVLVFAFGSDTSGIPLSWSASPDKPGINLLKDFSDESVENIRNNVHAAKQEGDIAVFSIHWGSNWGYEVPRSQQEFAHKLIDFAGIDVIHGHSSHHVKAIEVYKDKSILYGCGDFLNDYEGISGNEIFRGDLGLMYFVSIEPLSGKLANLQMTPTQVKKFRVNRASTINALWLRDTLNREGTRFGTRVELSEDNTLSLEWH